jgi:hypothetical protein
VHLRLLGQSLGHNANGTSTYLYGSSRIEQSAATKQYFGVDGLGSVRQI